MLVDAAGERLRPATGFHWFLRPRLLVGGAASYGRPVSRIALGRRARCSGRTVRICPLLPHSSLLVLEAREALVFGSEPNCPRASTLDICRVISRPLSDQTSRQLQRIRGQLWCQLWSDARHGFLPRRARLARWLALRIHLTCRDRTVHASTGNATDPCQCP